MTPSCEEPITLMRYVSTEHLMTGPEGIDLLTYELKNHSNGLSYALYT